MAKWKLGYPANLYISSSEAYGQGLYAHYRAGILSLSTRRVASAGGYVSGISGSRLTLSGTFSTGAFSGGFIKIRSGGAMGKVYRVNYNDGANFYLRVGDPYADGLRVGNYYELVTGEATFEFSRNPIRIDKKYSFDRIGSRYPYYEEGGYEIVTGFLEDDFVLQCFCKSKTEAADLLQLCNTKIGYDGYEAVSTGNFVAPLILQEGDAAAGNQTLVWVSDTKVIRDGNKSDRVIEVMLHLVSIGLPTWRPF